MSTFVNYLTDPRPLEERIDELFEELQVKPEDRIAIRAFLAPLRNKGPVHRFHYDHTLRVAILCAKVGAFVHVDAKALFFAGLLHDVGKTLIPATTLGKTSGWTESDSRTMEPHVMRGYEMIRDRFDFTAEIILWHHRFQKNGYPSEIPSPLHDYCLGNKVMIPFYGRLLSLCDQFDAFHRVNDKQRKVIVPTGEDIMLLMREHNPDQVLLIHQLYMAEIFTTHLDQVVREVTST